MFIIAHPHELRHANGRGHWAHSPFILSVFCSLVFDCVGAVRDLSSIKKISVSLRDDPRNLKNKQFILNSGPPFLNLTTKKKSVPIHQKKNLTNVLFFHMFYDWSLVVFSKPEKYTFHLAREIEVSVHTNHLPYLNWSQAPHPASTRPHILRWFPYYPIYINSALYNLIRRTPHI